MTLAERSRYEPQSARPREAFWRRRELHLIVGIVVAALTVAFAANQAVKGARAVLDDRLFAAGAGVDTGIVDVESLQLTAVRAIAFTPGVAQDLAAEHGGALNTLVAPLQANSTVPMVDMVLPNGKVLLAIRAKGAPLPVATRKGLKALTYAIDHAHGSRGGRLSELVVLPREGATLLTISPVVNHTKVVGAVLAMTPLANVLGRLAQEVNATLTVYDQTGEALATTADFVPPPLPLTTAQTLMGGGAVETRYMEGNNREKLGRLIVDHTADAVLGVSLPDNSSSVFWTVAIYVLIGLLCTVAILATFWARVVNARRYQ